MKIYLNGANGRMGKAVKAAAAEQGFYILTSNREPANIANAVVNAEVIIDFSSHEVTASLAAIAAQHDKPLVIGTTGHHEAERKMILQYQNQLPIVWAGNFSLGVNLLFYLTERVAATLPNSYHPEIVEIHHRMKKDAPSGTAENLVDAILRGRKWPKNAVKNGRSGITGERPDEEIGVHALRGGGVIGEHTVLFAGPGERIELKHQAADRRIFAEGALIAAQWLITQQPGLYNMQDVLGLK